MLFSGSLCHLIIGSHWTVTDGAVGKWDYTPFNVTCTRENHAFKIPLLHDPIPHWTLRLVIEMEQGGHLVSAGAHLQSAFPSCLTTKPLLLVWESQENAWAVCSIWTREPSWPFSCQNTRVLPVLYQVLLRMCAFGGGQKQIGEAFHPKSSFATKLCWVWSDLNPWNSLLLKCCWIGETKHPEEH